MQVHNQDGSTRLEHWATARNRFLIAAAPPVVDYMSLGFVEVRSVDVDLSVHAKCANDTEATWWLNLPVGMHEVRTYSIMRPGSLRCLLRSLIRLSNPL